MHREGPLDASIRIHPIGGSALVRDYLHGTGAARRFYASAPHDLDAFRQKLAEVAGRFGPEERRQVAAALRPTSERAARRLDTFVREGGAVITTGQQSGLFTGPLYTIHKALTTARLAQDLEAELGVTVLPVFWNASEDHDWAEVNHAFLLEREDVVRIELPPVERRAAPMSELTLGGDLDVTLDRVSQLVAGKPHADRCMTLVRGAYRPGVSVAAAFESVLAGLLAPFDMLITDAADPALKARSVRVLMAALRDAPRHEAVLSERTAALLDAGYHGQAAILEGATNVFFHGSGQRERLYVDAGGLTGSDTGARLSMGEAAARIAEDPTDFSPNVLLRPVVESEVFPTLAYVGGPGEMAYFAQLMPLFGELGIAPPVVYPRASATVVERGMEERLAGIGFGLEELARPRHELIEEMAQRAMPRPVRDALERLSGEVSSGYRDLVDAAIDLDPTLAGALGAIRNESLSHIGRAERKVLRRLKRLQQERSGELDRVRASLAPGGQPQERVLNVMGFLASHGPDLLQSIADAIRSPWGAAVR